jgi:hypothetical protein
MSSRSWRAGSASNFRPKGDTGTLQDNVWDGQNRELDKGGTES